MPRKWAESTLGERVEYAIKLAALGSQNDFARAAGLKTATLSRAKNDANPTAQHRAGDTIAAIARTAMVDTAWLVSGVGEPKGKAAEPVEPNRYPSKTTAAKALAGIVDPEAIDAMLSEEHRGSTEDPGAPFWVGRAKWWHQERKRLAAELKAPAMPAEMDEAPKIEARPKKKR